MRLFRPSLLSHCLYPEAIFRIKSGEKILCLTFDDGPDPGSTPFILKVLEKHHVKGLFFCSGEAAEKYPDLVETIKDQGHTIGNHGYRHFDGWKTSYKKYLDDIRAAERLTSRRYFRPPYGHLRLSQYRRLRKIYKIILWDIMPYDFDKNFSAERSLNLLNRKIRPGSVIVLHDSPDSNCKYFLEDFIENSLDTGYRFEITI